MQYLQSIASFYAVDYIERQSSEIDCSPMQLDVRYEIDGNAGQLNGIDYSGNCMQSASMKSSVMKLNVITYNANQLNAVDKNVMEPNAIYCNARHRVQLTK